MTFAAGLEKIFPLASPGWIKTLGILNIFFECAWGVTLMGAALSPAPLAISAALLIAMAGGLFWWQWRGILQQCPCYGTWVRLTPRQAARLDLVYAVMILLAWPGSNRGLTVFQVVPAALATALFAGAIFWLRTLATPGRSIAVPDRP